jgi:cobalt-zinc-cadmium efflux system protein
MAHDHGHHHHGLGHGRGRTRDTAANERRVRIALFLTAGFFVVEAAGGLIAGSLALIADAGHMLTDAAALALTWLAFRVGRRPADPRRTFGYHRAQVLAAFVNGVVLIGVVGWIAIEAVRRLFDPIPVSGGIMLAIGIAGLGVNVVAYLLLRGGEDNLNLRGAALHVLGDLLSSGAAVAGALIILATGWTPADPLLSLFVAALVLRSAWSLVRRSGHILLEGTPDWLDVDALQLELAAAVPGVEGVHHVHVWSLTSERPMITFHATVSDAADRDRVLAGLQDHLKRRYGIEHTTIQIEHPACGDEAIVHHP